jgi:hypothetical protein
MTVERVVLSGMHSELRRSGDQIILIEILAGNVRRGAAVAADQVLGNPENTNSPSRLPAGSENKVRKK